MAIEMILIIPITVIIFLWAQVLYYDGKKLENILKESPRFKFEFLTQDEIELIDLLPLFSNLNLELVLAESGEWIFEKKSNYKTLGYFIVLKVRKSQNLVLFEYYPKSKQNSNEYHKIRSLFLQPIEMISKQRKNITTN
ncbi:hypothetical protein OAQ99_03970 [Candidatus Kapabacteria bacterium]|nr:hypothetical protein [Candidatus Kapabacteria bacterium]